MSTVVEVDECANQARTHRGLSLCRTMAEDAKLASRQLAVAPEAKLGMPGCGTSAASLATAAKRSWRPTPATLSRAGARARSPRRSSV